MHCLRIIGFIREASEFFPDTTKLSALSWGIPLPLDEPEQNSTNDLLTLKFKNLSPGQSLGGALSYESPEFSRIACIEHVTAATLVRGRGLFPSTIQDILVHLERKSRASIEILRGIIYERSS